MGAGAQSRTAKPGPSGPRDALISTELVVLKVGSPASGSTWTLVTNAGSQFLPRPMNLGAGALSRLGSNAPPTGDLGLPQGFLHLVATFAEHLLTTRWS